MIITALLIVLSTIIGTATLYSLLPANRKELSLLVPIFGIILIYLTFTVGIFAMAWLMISAFTGTPVVVALVLGTIWSAITFALGRSFVLG
jgi:hypothetical protein